MATSPRLAPTPIRDNAIVHHMAVLAALGSGSPEAARAAMDADATSSDTEGLKEPGAVVLCGQPPLCSSRSWSLLAEVEQDASAAGDALDRLAQLAAEVAAGRAEDVAGQALGVQAHRRGPAGGGSPRIAGSCSCPSARWWKVARSAVTV